MQVLIQKAADQISERAAQRLIVEVRCQRVSSVLPPTPAQGCEFRKKTQIQTVPVRGLPQPENEGVQAECVVSQV